MCLLPVALLTHVASRRDLSGGCVRSEKSWAEPVGAAPERAPLVSDRSLTSGRSKTDMLISAAHHS